MVRLIVFGLLLAVPQVASAKRKQVPINSVSIGVGVFPLQIKGLEDVHLSDVDVYPNAEGRLNLPLGSYNTDGPGLMPALKLGATFGRGNVLGAFDVYAGGVDGLSGGALLLGADIRVKQGKLLIGVPLRVGVIMGGAALGQAALLEGSTGPVILEAGGGCSLETRCIEQDDALQANITGFMASAGVLGEFWLTKKLALRAEASVQEGYFSGFEIAAGTDDTDTPDVDERVRIQGTDQAIKKTDGSSTHHEMTPSGGTFGVSGFVGVTLKF